jgi:hypothetical protein
LSADENNKKIKFLKLMSLTIVTSHWKENLEWLTKSKFPVVLIDKEGADPSPFVPQHVIPNLGNESTAYLKYIIENYDNLPEAVAFIHGHETSCHQNHDRPLLEVIEGANWQKYGFVPINNTHYAYGFLDEYVQERVSSLFTTSNPIRLYTFFDRLCIPLKGPKPDEGAPWIYDLGAQFVVSKERILANPKKLYEGWYYIFNHNLDFTKEFGYILEKAWHVTFGEQAVQMPQEDWFSFDWKPKRGFVDESGLHGIPIDFGWSEPAV